MRKIIHYISQHSNRKLTVAEIAQFAGFDRSYLSSKFRDEMGIPLSAFITQIKLEEAASLLHFSNQTIAEISEYLGFSNQSHFQASFKKYFGVTPRLYRLKETEEM
ncbi:Xylose operon regulatory protein [compost metagenome]